MEERNNDELLKYAVENGMIDLAYVQEEMEMNERKKILDEHPYKIWHGKDDKWYTYLPKQEKGRMLKKRNTREEIEDVVIKYWKERKENPTMSDIFTEWNDRRLQLKKISEATHLRYQQVFNRHYTEIGMIKIKSLNQGQVENFLEEQIAEFELTAKGFANLRTITRGMLKYAKKRGFISFYVEELFDDLDLSEKDFKPVVKEDYEEVFSETELPVMLRYLKENPDVHNLGIMLMFIAGLRIGELVALKQEDFLEGGSVIKVRRTETRYKEDGQYVCTVKDFPKTKAGVRDVVIPESYQWIYRALKNMNPFSEYVFMNNGKRLTASAIRRRMSNVCKILNIYPKSPHKARKTYGTILLDNHIDNKMIMTQMGHADIACTENHYHRNRKTLAKRTEIISCIPEFAAK